MLWSNYLSLPSNAHFETNLGVLKRQNLVGCVLILNIKLFNTFGIQTNVASKELEGVLEVLLLLVHCSVSNKSLLICESDDHSK